MSLVNSFINQIGREIAHDVYRNATTTNYYSRTKKKQVDFNESFLNEVKNFQLAGYDKVSVRQIINLIEKSKSVNPSSFDYQNCYIELDNKIDLCKQHLDKEQLQQLEELDRLNESNYKIAHSEHKTYVLELIKSMEDTKKDSLVLSVILSLVGLNPIYYKEKFLIIFNHLLGALVGLPCLVYSSLMLISPENFHGTKELKTDKDLSDLKHIAITLLVIGLIFYLPILFGSFKRISNHNKLIKNKESFLEKLKNYNSTLK